MPPDAPELVLAVKNAANYSKVGPMYYYYYEHYYCCCCCCCCSWLYAFQKLYTEAWDEDKILYYPYSDSPELRRVAKAQEVLSDVS